MLKSVGRFRESAGRLGPADPGSHRGLGRCAPSPGLVGRCDANASRRTTWPIGMVTRGLIGRAATTPMARRRPASSPGEQTASRSPREPGSAIVRSASRRRLVARRDHVPGTPMGRGFPLALVGFGRGSTPGWADIVGWASSLPVRDVEVGWAFREVRGGWDRRDSGRHRGLGRCAPSAPAFWSAVTPMRPGGPAWLHRRGRWWVDWKGCDHADGTPAACLVAGRADRIALPRSPVAPLCAARGGAGWWLQHNDVPGTPLGRGFPLALVGFGHGLGLPRSRSLSSALTLNPAAVPAAAPAAAADASFVGIGIGMGMGAEGERDGERKRTRTRDQNRCARIISRVWRLDAFSGCWFRACREFCSPFRRVGRTPDPGSGRGRRPRRSARGGGDPEPRREDPRDYALRLGNTQRHRGGGETRLSGRGGAPRAQGPRCPDHVPRAVRGAVPL